MTATVKNPAKSYVKKMKTPVGTLTLVATDRALVAVLWPDEKMNRVKLPELESAPDHPILQKTEKQLAEYFAGKRREFDLPLESRGTEFQKRVWKGLTKIPFGETRSYLELARKVGHPKACRAVGAANGRNPLSIVVPCHRVIGADGSLTGFAGGTRTKAFLLELERPQPRRE